MRNCRPSWSFRPCCGVARLPSCYFVLLLLPALLVCPPCSALNASECPADAEHSGNSLLQMASLRSRVDVPVEQDEEVSSSIGPSPPSAVASVGDETTSTIEEWPAHQPTLLDSALRAFATRSAAHDAAARPAHASSDAAVSINAVPAPSPSPVLLQVTSTGDKATEMAAAGARKWAAAVLLVRTFGTQLHGRLMATAATTGSYAMVSVAAVMCIVVLTAYLFLQSPGNLTEKESMNSDGTVHGSPTPHAATPRSMVGPRQASRLVLQARPASYISNDSRAFPAARHLLLPSTNLSLAHDPPPLTTPFSVSASPMSTGMSLASGAMPPSQRYLSRGPGEMPSSMATKGLCPGLIVPDNSECVLTICALSDVSKSCGNSTSTGPVTVASSARVVDILDLESKPVMRAHIVLPWPQDLAFKQRPPVITLCTMNPSTTKQEERLSLCRAGGEGGGRRSMYIYDKDDVLFGCIKRDVTRPRYVLTSSRGGLQLLFEGDFHGHTVNVLSDNRDMLSHSEPCGSMKADNSSSFYQVRITAGIDVGLIVSGLLSIEAMEAT